MKKIIFILLAVVAAGMTSLSASPDIKDVLKGLGSKSSGTAASGEEGSSSSSSSGLGALGSLISGIVGSGEVTTADLVGSWKYDQPAVKFQSDNLLQKAGGAAASKVITDKLAPYYSKVGIDKMTATFEADSTFKFVIGKINLSGTVMKDTESTDGGFIFQFSAVGKLPIGKVKAQIEKSGSDIVITFDASKLISLVNTIAKVSGQSTLQTVSNLLNSYDGLACGFELSPVSK